MPEILPLSEASPGRVLIIGAGPAGLALAACLTRHGLRATLLETGETPGWSWVQRYSSLRLHTTRRDSRLPSLALADGDPYPSAAQYAAYCARYARVLGLDVRLRAEVKTLRRGDGLWQAETAAGVHRARVAVIATGAQRSPWRPRIAGEERFGGPLLHSSDYRSGERFRGQSVLVVGGGNTAMDLAADLLAHGALPTLSIRGPVHLMARDAAALNWHRRQRAALLAPLALAKRLPPALGRLARRLAAGRAAAAQRRRYGDLEARGLRLADANTILERVAQRRSPTVDGGSIDLLRRGVIAIRPELVRLEPGVARFAPGPRHGDSAAASAAAALPVAAVIFATGFRADFAPWLDVAHPAERPFVAGETPLLSAIRREAPALARRVLAAASS
jgi:cation diffusion facilitator CzcD-associated flavoprotein CzcO